MHGLITGASTGIGRATARMFAQQGMRVFASVRKEADADSIRAEGIEGLIPILMDLLSEESIKRATEQIRTLTHGEGLNFLVNNAGVACVGPMEYACLDTWRRQLETNVLGTVAVTKHCLPLLREGTSPRIVNVGSIAGLASLGFMAPYCASKHALEAITSALRMELAPFGIHVTIVSPGNVLTPIWNKESMPSSIDTSDASAVQRYLGTLKSIERNGLALARRGVPPETVAKTLLRAVTARRPRTHYFVGWDARMIRFGQCVLPRSWFEAFTRLRYRI